MEVISSEEFSFENINNLTPSRGLKIFNGDFVGNTQLESLFYFTGSLKHWFFWNEKNIKSQVK